ncbi:MAG: hypothetical protein NY202_04395 [Mollicutes bacterium UO1]
MMEKNFETIERDLYPERNKNKGGSRWIWLLAIGVIIVIGLVGLIWWKSNKKRKKYE